MNTKTKVCVVTGNRSEFGLLTPLLRLLESDESLEDTEASNS